MKENKPMTYGESQAMTSAKIKQGYRRKPRNDAMKDSWRT
jgi:hypothetical protein